MKCETALMFVLAVSCSLNACDRNKEPGRAAVQQKGSAGYVISFKPNDSPDLVPAKTLMLAQAPAPGKNQFCLDVNAKAFDQVADLSFTLTFDSALVEYRSFRPGTLFEPKGKVAYRVAPPPDQKGKLRVEVTFESGGTTTGGTGKAVTLCFEAKNDGRSDMSLESGQVLDVGKKPLPDVTWVGGLVWVLTG